MEGKSPTFTLTNGPIHKRHIQRKLVRAAPRIFGVEAFAGDDDELIAA